MSCPHRRPCFAFGLKNGSMRATGAMPVVGGKGRAAETVPQNLRAMEKLKIAVVSLSGGTVVNRKSVPPKRAESVAVASGR